MADAAVLEELQELINDDVNAIPSDQVNKLVLACVIKLYRQQQELQDMVEPLVAQMKIIRAVGTIIIGLVIVFIWEVLTHKVVITP